MARERGRRKGVVVFLALSLLLGAVGTRGLAREVDPAREAPAVAAVQGSGFLDKAMCLGCGAVLVSISGTTIGGFLVGAALWPEMYGGCIYQCYVAFS